MSIKIHSRGRLLQASRPIIMGIINVTPDSFYIKGQGDDQDTLLKTVEKMLNDGAAIIDVGGASTKPGQELLSPEEELPRVIPVITAILKEFPDTWLSVDTYNAPVAKWAVDAGASIVNDVSSGRFDKAMLSTVAELGVPYIVMHMQGTPRTMQVSPEYINVVEEVYNSLESVCANCEAAGIKDVIIDPGFGFGKTVQHNFQLLRSLTTFQKLGKPILAGLSRKSMICKPLRVNPDRALNGTTALNMAALQHGADILRVHDVKEAAQVITLFELLNEAAAG